MIRRLFLPFTKCSFVSEMVCVLQKYLVPQARHMSGMDEKALQIDTSAMNTLIAKYCRESGVRNLQKHIEKVSSLIIRLHSDSLQS